jgi:hypothetical protein
MSTILGPGEVSRAPLGQGFSARWGRSVRHIRHSDTDAPLAAD